MKAEDLWAGLSNKHYASKSVMKLIGRRNKNEILTHLVRVKATYYIPILNLVYF